MLRLVDAEHVAAIKWSVPEGEDYDQMRKFSHIFNVIDNTNQPVRCHKNGGRGYISALIAAYPQHDLEVWQLLEAHRYEEAQAKLDCIRNASRHSWLSSPSGQAAIGLVRACRRPWADPSGHHARPHCRWMTKRLLN